MDLAIDQLKHLQPGDVAINDGSFTGCVYLLMVRNAVANFIGRCSTGSFACAQDLFRANRANQSHVVWLFAPQDQKATCLALGTAFEIESAFC